MLISRDAVRGGGLPVATSHRYFGWYAALALWMVMAALASFFRSASGVETRPASSPSRPALCDPARAPADRSLPTAPCRRGFSRRGRAGRASRRATGDRCNRHPNSGRRMRCRGARRPCIRGGSRCAPPRRRTASPANAFDFGHLAARSGCTRPRRRRARGHDLTPRPAERAVGSIRISKRKPSEGAPRYGG